MAANGRNKRRDNPADNSAPLAQIAAKERSPLQSAPMSKSPVTTVARSSPTTPSRASSNTPRACPAVSTSSATPPSWTVCSTRKRSWTRVPYARPLPRWAPT